jgi:thioredoxin reductase (NADPH)
METIGFDLRQTPRTPLLPSHVAAMTRIGIRKSYPKGTMLAQPGDRMDRFTYVVEGEIEVVNAFTGLRHLESTLGPNQYMGEVAFLSGGAYSMPMRAAVDTVVIEVERQPMLDLMAAIPEMSDIIISVLVARRRRQLEEADSALVVIGEDASPAVARVAAFASRNKIPYRALELGSEAARAAVSSCRASAGRPVVVFGKTHAMEEPSVAEVAKLLGLSLDVDVTQEVDVLIVGGGPAGVAAAVYAGAEGLSALLVEDIAVGGQAGTSSRIENYMGFPTGISGADLVWRGEIQALKFGTRFAMPKRVQSLYKKSDGQFCASFEDGDQISAKAIVAATGVQYRRLPIAGLEHYEGAGVYYAATEYEARFCRNSEVAVIGAGNSAGQAAMFLSRHADRVHVLVRGGSAAQSMSSYLLNRLMADPKIDIHFHTEVVAVAGDARLQSITVRNTRAGTEASYGAKALFVMVGAAPNTDWLSGLVALDTNGFVKTGEEGRSPYETSEPGIFAVGDVRAGSVKRVAAAVGEGSVVISKVWEHVNAGPVVPPV